MSAMGDTRPLHERIQRDNVVIIYAAHESSGTMIPRNTVKC